MKTESEEVEIVPIIMQGAAGKQLCVGFYRHEAKTDRPFLKALHLLQGKESLRV